MPTKFLPRRLAAGMINEIAKVDTPAGCAVIEIGYRGGVKYMRKRRREYLLCGVCHHYSGEPVCARCARMALLPVPPHWVSGLVALRKPDPLDRSVDPELVARVVIARFLGHTKRSASGCLEWQAKRDDDGYGKFWIFGDEIRAHRFVFAITKGQTDRLVCHTCDNPPCVEEDHLFAGSVQDNSDDMVEKGRSTRGERNGTARLTEATVAAIRGAAATTPRRALAAKYGVVKGCIDAIVSRKTWRHVP